MEISDLETRQKCLIDGVNPEDVTVAYIHEQREKRIYPKMRFGGRVGLSSLTKEELDRLGEIAFDLL